MSMGLSSWCSPVPVTARHPGARRLGPGSALGTWDRGGPGALRGLRKGSVNEASYRDRPNAEWFLLVARGRVEGPDASRLHLRKGRDGGRDL
jgi:hypothetical protein